MLHDPTDADGERGGLGVHDSRVTGIDCLDGVKVPS